MSENWFLYMVETECGALYTGIATDVERRFSEHLAMRSGGTKGAKYFRGRVAKQVVYTEAFETRSAASKREYELKTWSRARKLALIGRETQG